ncbi:MAG TPA: hypothetical protein VEC38_10305 [Candidatus Binataceae bacterium]|nr:hypothetical protein [Candidatus Binataceae bacterium]
MNQLGSVAYNLLGVKWNPGSEPEVASKHHLLEKGVALEEPRCAACGHVFGAPRSSGECFDAAIPYLAPAAQTCACHVEKHYWLFAGSSILIAPASPALAPLFEKSKVFIGDRILIARAHSGEGGAVQVVFCADCGETIVAKADRAVRQNYAWDHLVEFAPRPILTRMRLLPMIGRSLAHEGGYTLKKSPQNPHDRENNSVLESDGRVRALCFARDQILEGRCRLREISLRALRAQVPVAELKAAFQALGATFARADNGNDILSPPEGFPANLDFLRIRGRDFASSRRTRDHHSPIHHPLRTQFAGTGR